MGNEGITGKIILNLPQILALLFLIHTLARPYEEPEERDAGFYGVSLKLILIFIIHYCF